MEIQVGEIVLHLDEETLSYSIRTGGKNGTEWRWSDRYRPVICTEKGDLSFLEWQQITHTAFRNGIGEGIHSTFRSFRGKADSYAFDTVVWVEAVNGTVHFEWIPICENDLAVQQLCQRNRERCFPRSRGTADHDDISLVCQTAFPAPFW